MSVAIFAQTSMIRAREAEYSLGAESSWVGALPGGPRRSEEEAQVAVAGQRRRTISTLVLGLQDFHEHYRSFARLLCSSSKPRAALRLVLRWIGKSAPGRRANKFLDQLRRAQ